MGQTKDQEYKSGDLNKNVEEEGKDEIKATKKISAEVKTTKQNKTDDKAQKRSDGDSASQLLRSWLATHSIILTDPWADPSWGFQDNDDIPNQDELKFTDPTCGREEEEGTAWSGQFNSEGRYEGPGKLTWPNGDYFQGSFTDGSRSGWGLVSSPEKDIQSLTGTWANGHLQGKGRLVTFETAVTESWYRRSCLHGPARRIVMKKFRTFRQQVSWLGRYRWGRPTGQCWEWQEGGGFITGKVGVEGSFTGDDVAFLYPDLETALVGKFKNGVMVEAYPASLTSISIVDDIPVPGFTRDLSHVAVGYSKSSISSVGDHPLVEDPYERKTCKVKRSNVDGGGEGLYAVRDILAGEIVAFYNGVRLPYIPGEKEEWETSGYKIFINADYKSGERIDLPGDLIHTTNYSATLGHKMNHSFEPNCTEWFFKHPRHDLVPCAVAKRNIARNEELFLHYGYDPLNCPAWYRETLDTYLADHPHLELWQVVDPERQEKEKVPWYQDTLKSAESGESEDSNMGV